MSHLRPTDSAPADERAGSCVPFHQVLILLAAYLFSSGGEQALSEHVHDAVEDAQRREAAVAIAEEIERELGDHLERIVAHRAFFFEVARRYEATSEELSVALERGADEVERFQAQLVDLRFRLRDEMGAGEWKRLCEELEPQPW